MSCRRNTVDYCLLKQETFSFLIFDFKDLNISDDSFEYSINKIRSLKKQNYKIDFLSNNSITIEPFELPLGEYEHELLWTRNGRTVIVFQGVLTIVDKINDYHCDTTVKKKENISIEFNDKIVQVSYSERITDRYVWTGNFMSFSINDNMELILTETVSSGLNFNIENGFLVLK